MNKIFLDTNYSIIKPRISALQKTLSDVDNSTVPNMIGEFIYNISYVLREMSKPMFSMQSLTDMDRPSASEFNASMRNLDNDISVCYQGIQDIKKNMDVEFNSTVSDLDDLIEESESIFQEIESININIDKEDTSNTVTAGTDFRNASMIDMEYGIDADICYLDKNQGGITLPVDSEIQIDPSQATIKIADVNKGKDGPYNKGHEPINFFYEGKFYGKINESIPEGGKWIIDITKSDESISEEDRLLLNEVQGRTAEDSPSFITKLINGTTVLNSESQIDYPRFKVSISKPSESNLMKSRMAMLDRNPATSWQCEWVYRPGSISDSDIKRVNTNRSNYLDIVLTIDIGQHFRMNKIYIDPVVFGEQDDVHVIDISTSKTRDETPKPLDFQGYGVYNEQISDSNGITMDDFTSHGTISPSSFSQKWGESWIFDMREVRFINIQLRQYTSYVVSYQTKKIDMTRTATAVSRIEQT